MAIYYNQTVIVADVGIHEDAGRLAKASCTVIYSKVMAAQGREYIR